MESTVAQRPLDIGAEWEAALKTTADADPAVQLTGSKRASAPVSAVEELRIKARDVEPLVAGIGGAVTRIAGVSDLTKEERQNIAEPAAHLLSILAPQLPPWALPLSALSARIAEAGAARKEEFAAAQRKRATESAHSGDSEPSDARDDVPTIVDRNHF